MPYQTSSQTSSPRYPHAYAKGGGYYDQPGQATIQRNMPSRAPAQYPYPGSTMQRAMPEDTRMYGTHHGADTFDNYRDGTHRGMEHGPRVHQQQRSVPARPSRSDPRNVHIPRTSSRGSDQTDNYPYVTQSLDTTRRMEHMRMMQRDMPHASSAPPQQQQQQPFPVMYSPSTTVEMSRPHSMTEYSTYGETRRTYVGRAPPGQQSAPTNHFSSIDQLRSRPAEGYPDTVAFSRGKHPAPVRVQSPRAHIRHMPYAPHMPPREAHRMGSSVQSSPESATSA